MLQTFELVAFAIVGLGITYTLLTGLFSRRKVPCPPGPKGYPIIGNILDVPSTLQWLAYHKMGSDSESPVISLDMLGTSLVIVNNRDAANDVFWKRSTLYSDRPRLTMLNDIAGYSWTFGFMPSTHPEWKISRRLFDQQFKESESRKLRPQILDGVKLLLRELAYGHSERKMERQFRFLVVRIILDVVYGIDVNDPNSPFVEIVEAGLDDLDNCVGYDILEAFPALRLLPSWLPYMGWKQESMQWRKHAANIKDAPFEEVRTGRCSRASIASRLIEELGEGDQKILPGVLATAFSAASDTTAALLHTFVLVLTLFPSVQNTLMEEIDRMTGHDCLPDFNVKASLPYTQAFCWELIRWSCIMPLALPHRCLEDDIWFDKSKRMSYLIPKGAIVLGNSWAMCNDSKVYSNPEEFNPARFLTADGARLNPSVNLPDIMFGYGARSCPGRWMAEDIIWSAVTSISSLFVVKRTLCSPTWHNNFDELMTPTFVRHPKPFEFEMVLRREGKDLLL